MQLVFAAYKRTNRMLRREWGRARQAAMAGVAITLRTRSRRPAVQHGVPEAGRGGCEGEGWIYVRVDQRNDRCGITIITILVIPVG